MKEKISRKQEKLSPLMKNREYRQLSRRRNQLIKQINFAEERLAKYAYAMSAKESQQLQQRIDAAASLLADTNDRMADIEDGIGLPVHWTGRASKALRMAS